MCALLIENFVIYPDMLRSKITIVIPSRSYDKNLSFCIKKIRQIYKKIKIIIILDKKESFKKDKNISVLVSGNKTIGYKRNLAVKHCKTDYVYFIDSDAYPTTSWLDQVDKTFKKYKRAAAIGGPNLSPPTNNIEKKLVSIFKNLFFVTLNTAVKSRKKIEGTINFLPSSNLAVKTKIYKKLRGMYEELYSGEELPLILNIKKNKVFVGYHMRFNPLIQFIKNKIKNKKIWSINIFCGSYLPNWRKNRDYRFTSSARKRLGGGVILDLSHELDYTQWLLGDITIDNAVSKKLSNLKIDTDDFLSISGEINKLTRVQIDLNYFTKKETRRIIIDGENISINADLIEKKIFISEKNKTSVFAKPNLHKNISYDNLHRSLLSNDHKMCCSYKEGKKIMILINKIRKFSRVK